MIAVRTYCTYLRGHRSMSPMYVRVQNSSRKLIHPYQLHTYIPKRHTYNIFYERKLSTWMQCNKPLLKWALFMHLGMSSSLVGEPLELERNLQHCQGICPCNWTCPATYAVGWQVKTESNVYVHVKLTGSIHTYICTYIHAYIHTYPHTYMYIGLIDWTVKPKCNKGCPCGW